jgi:small-conductance mechanosensitive channel
MLSTLTEWFHRSAGLSPEIQRKLFTSIVIILILWFVHRLILRIVLPRIKGLPDRYRWKKTSGYIAAAVGIAIILRVWFKGIESLATFLGLLSAGVAIALKDMLANLAGLSFYGGARLKWAIGFSSEKMQEMSLICGSFSSP